MRRVGPAAVALTVLLAIAAAAAMALGRARAQSADQHPPLTAAPTLLPTPSHRIGFQGATPASPGDPARTRVGPPTPVPTPGETDYEYRNRVMDAEMAYRQGVTVEQLLATRSAGATATRAAMGSMRSLPDIAVGFGYGSPISFADSHRGWIAATSGAQRQALLATSDGGRHWAKLRELDFIAYDLDFVSATKGWAATAQGLFATDDGGRSWRPMAEALPVVPTVPAASVTLSSDRLQRVDFVDALHGWGARWVPQARTLALVRTTDGGSTWTSLADPCPAAGPVSASEHSTAHTFKGIGPFSATGATTAWVLCRGEPDPHGRGFPKSLFHTRDGGQTWQLASEVVPPAVTPGPSPTWSSTPRPTPSPVPPGATGALPLLEWPEEMVFVDDRVGWIGTTRGSVYATPDGGRTWTEVAGGESPLSLKEFRHLHFLSPTQGYTFFRRFGPGALLHTSDGGRTWTQLYPPDPAAYAGLSPCRAADVHAVHAGWLGADDASALLTISSRSGRPCVLQGRPTVELLGAVGETVPHSPAPVTPVARDPGPVVFIQPEQRAHLHVIWRTRCHEKPAGPVTVRFWLPGESPDTDPPVVPDHEGMLELQQTPEALKFRCESPAGPPRLDVGFFTPLDPPVTP